jgi:hypothetical protein
LEGSPAFSAADGDAVTKWFADYLNWMSTSPNGIDERDAKNTHGTCWVMQVAEFAKFTGNAELVAQCADRFKTSLVPIQIAANGSFPAELARTKPYGYSLFNLDAMAAVCQILSKPGEEVVAAAARRRIFRPVAHTPAQPAFRRPGIRARRLSGSVAQARTRSDYRRDYPQRPNSSAAALDIRIRLARREGGFMKRIAIALLLSCLALTIGAVDEPPRPHILGISDTRSPTI